MDSTISSKSELLLAKLKEFYSQNNNKYLILPIIKGETSISLRLLDWLVTNYAKRYNVNYDITQGGTPINFNIYHDYRNQLNAYSKAIFDPFSRRQRIFYFLETDETIYIEKKDPIYQNRKDGFITTVGQLNFFRWALTKGVINYAFRNINAIESDMLDTSDKRKNTKNRKRESYKQSKGVYKYDVCVVIKFP